MFELRQIAHIVSPYKTKFGIPRQSGIAGEVKASVVFEPEYAVAEAVRGLEAFSHIWLIWQFSEAVRDTWSPTVRPPRLGGNVRVGVFASRSPFRPNFMGLSSVELESVELDPELGPVLHVKGADLMDGTPIFDIKPYIAYADCHPDAKGGFTSEKEFHGLEVSFADGLEKALPESLILQLRDVLKSDPRPQYHDDPGRVYGLSFGGYEVKFTVAGDTLNVIDAKKEA